MDEIEFFVKCPSFLEVIDLKTYVRRDEGRLDGREVNTSDLGLGMLVRKINCPYPGPSSNIEHVIEFGVVEWGKVQLST